MAYPTASSDTPPSNYGLLPRELQKTRCRRRTCRYRFNLYQYIMAYIRAKNVLGKSCRSFWLATGKHRRSPLDFWCSYYCIPYHFVLPNFSGKCCQQEKSDLLLHLIMNAYTHTYNLVLSAFSSIFPYRLDTRSLPVYHSSCRPVTTRISPLPKHLRIRRRHILQP